MREVDQLAREYFNGLGGEYNLFIVEKTESENITPTAGCYGFFCVNISDGTVWVNGFPLLGFVAPGLYGGSFGFIDNYRLYAGTIDLNIPVTGLTVISVVVVEVCKIG